MRPTAHLTLLEDEARAQLQICSTSLPESSRPRGWQWFSAWLDDGWFPIDLTGNGERNFAIIVEQHFGDPMRLAAFVSVKEKDDGIKIKARTDDVADLPDNWDSGLAAWTKAGWDLVQVTGNREHGWGWLLVKAKKDKDA